MLYNDMCGFRSNTSIFCIREEIASPHPDQLKHGGKINEFKIKDNFFGREFSRQKGLEKLCEIFKSQ